MNDDIASADDVAISESRQYFVVTEYQPLTGRVIRHAWGPARYSVASRKAQRIITRNAKDPRAEHLRVMVVRWRGGL